jgi:hypothetical protein
VLHQVLVSLVLVHSRFANHGIHFLLYFIYELFSTLAFLQLKAE